MKRQDYRTLHEDLALSALLNHVVDFVLKDKNSIDKISKGITDRIDGKKVNQIVSGNIAKSAMSLTATFPVIVTEATDVETAVMVSKAVERKSVGMLHMLFAANQITNVTSATEYLKQFHSNVSSKLDLSTTDIDDVLDFSSSYTESHGEPNIDPALIQAVAEDCRVNCSNVLSYDLPQVAISDYSVIKENGKSKVVKNASFTEASLEYTGYNRDEFIPNYEGISIERDPSGEYRVYRSPQEDRGGRRGQQGTSQQPEVIATFRSPNGRFDGNTMVTDANGNRVRLNQLANMTQNTGPRSPEISGADMKSLGDFERNRQLQLDIKKANEAMPSLMVVNFIRENEQGRTVNSVCVIGVKAMLHYVSSSDLINRIVLKNTDNRGLFNFIRATTREISFFKDFLFSINKAKVDAIAKSGKGSSNKLWKLLELRANRLKLAKASNVKEAEFAAITSMIISAQEVEMIKTHHRIDLTKPGTMLSIMRGYNLMAAFIVDPITEKVDFIYDDGSKNFETLSFSSLEREEAGSMYKKIINLTSKGR